MPPPMSGAPPLIALAGLPGAGKSTLARYLARQLRLPVVDRDLIRRELIAEPTYSGRERATVVRATLEAAALHLAGGSGCIIDGMSFASAADRQKVRKLAAESGATAIIMLLKLAPGVAAQRIEAQKGNHPAGNREPGLAPAVAKRFEAIEADVLVIDAAQAPDKVCRAALQRLRGRDLISPTTSA